MMLGSFFASDMLWAVILLTDTFVWQPLRGPLVVRQFQLEDRGAIVRSSGLPPRYYCAHCILSSRSRIATTRSGRSLRAWRKMGQGNSAAQRSSVNGGRSAATPETQRQFSSLAAFSSEVEVMSCCRGFHWVYNRQPLWSECARNGSQTLRINMTEVT